MPFLASAALALVYASTVLAWTWPNARLERLDALRFDQFTARPTILQADTSPCDKFNGSKTSGHRTNAADWIRTASPRLNPN
jgi:hypothetical protein